jgi:hypothetical protein
MAGTEAFFSNISKAEGACIKPINTYTRWHRPLDFGGIMRKKNGLKIMLPFAHYRPELPEVLQGALMIAVGLSAVPILQESLGFSYEAALTAVALAEALGLHMFFFADPSFRVG